MTIIGVHSIRSNNPERFAIVSLLSQRPKELLAVDHNILDKRLTGDGPYIAIPMQEVMSESITKAILNTAIKGSPYKLVDVRRVFFGYPKYFEELPFKGFVWVKLKSQVQINWTLDVLIPLNSSAKKMM